MMLGPKKPPLEPIALMSAIPAAADVPLRNFVGRHQNGDINKEVLRGRNAKAITRSSACGNKATAMQAAQSRASASAARPQRSSQRSDSNPARG